MDVLIGVLVLAAMIFVFTRPFRDRSDRDKKIYRQLAGLDNDDFEGRQPCPNCGEMILPEAKVCRYCGKEVTWDES